MQIAAGQIDMAVVLTEGCIADIANGADHRIMGKTLYNRHLQLKNPHTNATRKKAPSPSSLSHLTPFLMALIASCLGLCE